MLPRTLMLALPVAGIALLAASTSMAQTTSGTTASGTSNALNPALSLNALFLGSVSDPSTEEDGLKAQELELAFTSVVDPYFKAIAFVAYEPDPEGPESEVALEEVYVQTTALPAGWGLLAGRFFLPLGRHNQLHTHLYPFTQAPLAVASILGEESAGDVGVQVSYIPLLPWYMNLRVTGGDGAVEGLFDGASRDLSVGGRLENLWDLSPSTTLEAAASYQEGPDPEGGRRRFFGVDLRIKNRDQTRSQGRTLEGVVELLLDGAGDRPDASSVYGYARARLARRIWATFGYSWVSRIPEEAASRGSDHELRANFAFTPSEFSAIRIEGGWRDRQDLEENEAFAQIQLNFTVGSHPAHAY